MINSCENESLMQYSPIRSKLNTERLKHKILLEAEKNRSMNKGTFNNIDYINEFPNNNKRLKSNSLKDTFSKFSALFIQWKNIKESRNLSSKKQEFSYRPEKFHCLKNPKLGKSFFKEKEESKSIPHEIGQNLKSNSSLDEMKNMNAFKEIPNNIIPIFSTMSISKVKKILRDNQTIPVINKSIETKDTSRNDLRFFKIEQSVQLNNEHFFNLENIDVPDDYEDLENRMNNGHHQKKSSHRNKSIFDNKDKISEISYCDDERINEDRIHIHNNPKKYSVYNKYHSILEKQTIFNKLSQNQLKLQLRNNHIKIKDKGKRNDEVFSIKKCIRERQDSNCQTNRYKACYPLKNYKNKNVYPSKDRILQNQSIRINIKNQDNVELNDETKVTIFNNSVQKVNKLTASKNVFFVNPITSVNASNQSLYKNNHTSLLKMDKEIKIAMKIINKGNRTAKNFNGFRSIKHS